MTDFGITVPRPFADLSDLEVFAIRQQLTRQCSEEPTLENYKRLAAAKTELFHRGCQFFSEVDS